MLEGGICISILSLILLLSTHSVYKNPDHALHYPPAPAPYNNCPYASLQPSHFPSFLSGDYHYNNIAKSSAIKTTISSPTREDRAVENSSL